MPSHSGWQNEHHFQRGRITSDCRGARRRPNQTLVNASPKDPCQDCFAHELRALRAMIHPSARELPSQAARSHPGT